MANLVIKALISVLGDLCEVDRHGHGGVELGETVTKHSSASSSVQRGARNLESKLSLLSFSLSTHSLLKLDLIKRSLNITKFGLYTSKLSGYGF